MSPLSRSHRAGADVERRAHQREVTSQGPDGDHELGLLERRCFRTLLASSMIRFTLFLASM